MADEVRKPEESEFVQVAKKTFSSLGPAIRQALLYTLLGILIGILLLWWKHHLDETQFPYVFWSRFLEHLGLGFIVSAIAVFFYEWGAHVKETVDLSKKLNETIQSVESKIAPLLDSAGEQSLDHALRAMIGKGVQPMPENIQRIITDCSTLVKDISELQAPKVWSSDKFVDFISYLLHGVVENATSLKPLAVTGQGNQSVIVASTAAIMADEILSLQMQAMREKDSYEVMSSLPTWKGEQLSKFHKETEQAVKRGVTVKRIFNRLRYPEAEKNLLLDETREILESHLTNCTEWSRSGKGKYEVKILSEADLKTNKSLRDRAQAAHFGIFQHPKESICYSVNQADLSHMTIVKNKIIVHSQQELFDDVWAVASDLTQPLINALLKEIEEHQKQQTKAQYDDMIAKEQQNDDDQETTGRKTPSGPPSAISPGH